MAGSLRTRSWISIPVGALSHVPIWCILATPPTPAGSYSTLNRTCSASCADIYVLHAVEVSIHTFTGHLSKVPTRSEVYRRLVLSDVATHLRHRFTERCQYPLSLHKILIFQLFQPEDDLQFHGTGKMTPCRQSWKS